MQTSPESAIIDNKPYISKGGGAFCQLDCSVDFVLGIMEDMPYREQHIDLYPGDGFYLYTDGVTEAFDAEGEMFSDQGLEDALNRHMEHSENPELLVEDIYGELSCFSQGIDQSDLCLTHHEWGRSDCELEKIEEKARQQGFYEAIAREDGVILLGKRKENKV